MSTLRRLQEGKYFFSNGEDERILSEKAPGARKVYFRSPWPFIIRGEEVFFSNNRIAVDLGIYWGIVAVSGNARTTMAQYSLIIAGGNVKARGSRLSIIVCDGDVEFSSFTPERCLIIARGKVTCASGKFTGCLIRSGRSLQLPDDRKIDLKDGAFDPLAFVKFFELADVGLAAEDLHPHEKSDNQGARIKDVRKESLFAAGLRPGDVIISLHDKKTPTTELFRRALRRTLAEGGPMITFTVQRAGKTLEVPIPVKD